MPTGNPFTSAQAPQMLTGSPYTEDQQSILRQQMIADLLRKQSLEPIGDTQMVGGWAVQRSPLEGAAKLAQALGANWTQQQADEKNKQLGERYKTDLSNTLMNAQNALQGTPAQTVDDESGGHVKPAQAGSQSAYYQALMGHPATMQMGMQGMQSDMQAQMLMRALQGGQGAAGGAGGTSGTQDTIAGLNPTAARLMMLPGGEKLGAAVQEANKPIALREGDLVRPGANGFASVYTQPKLESGMQPVRGADGKVMGAEAIPGYASGIASITGAKEGEKAQRDLITVDTPDGPRLMTKAQAAEQATGRPAVADIRGNPQDNMKLIDAIENPQERAAARKAYLENNKIGASGIPLQESGAKKFSETIATQSGEKLLESRDKAKVASDTIQGIGQAREAIKSGAFQSTGADMKLGLTKFINATIPGVSIAADKAGNTDYLKSILGSGLLEQAKTLGSNPSNADAQRINDIVGSIGKDPKAMDKILDWREEMAMKSINGHNSTVDDAEKRGMKSPYDLRIKAPEIKSGAPKAGMIKNGYRFKGGDPAKPESWEKV